MFRSTSLSSGNRVANLAETAGEVAALSVSVSQAVVVGQTLAQAQAARTLYVERCVVVCLSRPISRVQCKCRSAGISPVDPWNEAVSLTAGPQQQQQRKRPRQQ